MQTSSNQTHGKIMIQASSMTFEEKLRYGKITRDDVWKALEEKDQQIELARKETLDTSDSTAWEQIGFAQTLLDNIIDVLQQETKSPKIIKQRIISLISESLFER